MSRAVSGPIAPSALVGLEFSFDLLNFEDMLPLPQQLVDLVGSLFIVLLQPPLRNANQIIGFILRIGGLIKLEVVYLVIVRFIVEDFDASRRVRILLFGLIGRSQHLLSLSQSHLVSSAQTLGLAPQFVLNFVHEGKGDVRKSRRLVLAAIPQHLRQIVHSTILYKLKIQSANKTANNDKLDSDKITDSNKRSKFLNNEAKLHFRHFYLMRLSKPRMSSAHHASSGSKTRQSQRLKTQNNLQLVQESQNLPRHFMRQQSFKKRRTYTKPNYIETQQVLQENTNLKAFVNDLQAQLHQQRSRLEMTKRKTTKIAKQFNRQFSKQLYYADKNPNSYMISGIKHQYEKAKQMYEQKCLENEEMRRYLSYCDVQQMKTYIQMLEEENRKLKVKIERDATYQSSFNRSGDVRNSKKVKKSKPKQGYEQVQRIHTEYSAQNDNPSEFTHNDSLVILTNQLQEEKDKNIKANSIITKYIEQYKFLEKQYKQSEKRIQFLEKVIIEKDNNVHQAKRQVKTVQKSKHDLERQMHKLKQEIKTNEESFSKRLILLRQKQVKKYEIESEIFKKSLQEKNDMIDKLEKEIRYLSTLLSYWKPLDELNRDNSKMREENYSFKQISDKINEDKGQQSLKIKGHHKNRRQSVQSEQILLGLDFGQQENEHQKSFKSNKEEEVIRRTGAVYSQSQQNVSAIANEKRLPQTCSRRHSASARKMRKVNVNQIRKYGNLLRYRFVGLNLKIDQIKQMFNCKTDTSREEQFPFKSEYISMRQVRQILKLAPFCLNEDAATAVSRYIVEDSSNDYVYCHEDNQIQRNIAKSIIKALIGEYHLSDKQYIVGLWDEMKQVYLPNMLLALKTLAPKGMISETKFVELIVGLGIELKQELKDWIIGQIILDSSSLQELNYRAFLSR